MAASQIISFIFQIKQPQVNENTQWDFQQKLTVNLWPAFIRNKQKADRSTNSIFSIDKVMRGTKAFVDRRDTDEERKKNQIEQQKSNFLIIDFVILI